MDVLKNKKILKKFACFTMLKRHILHQSHAICKGSTMSQTLKYVANYILWYAGNVGSLLTNLKLQKLVYYAQAWHLALHDEEIFCENFEAWAYGPVCRPLYTDYRAYGRQAIAPPDSEPEIESSEIKEHLDEVLEVFLSYTAYELQRMTHNEVPWKLARGTLPPTEPSVSVISKESMKTFYKSLSDSDAN